MNVFSACSPWRVSPSIHGYELPMHFADLTPCNYFPLDADGKFIAVGWLEPDHSYPHGVVEKEFVDNLAELLVNPWQPIVAMGYHRCGFCRLSGGPRSFRHGVSNI